VRTATTALLALVAVGCGGSQPEEHVAPVTLPFPAQLFAGRQIALFPATLVAADAALGWGEALGARADRAGRADSVLAEFLVDRVPEIDWVLPDALRAGAARAPGILSSPDKMGTAMLRAEGIEQVPDPLRSQMRNLTGVVADRYALVPAVVAFPATPDGHGSAEVTLVMVDVRFGTIAWRTVARGEADAPWDAMWEALKALTPDLP
jgi:hypothetical protein